MEKSKVKIPKRISTALLNSLTAGVVSRIGLEYITVGRKKEVDVLLDDLKNIEDGGAVFRFITGRYGSGKSFLIQLIRNHALKEGFVAMDADLSPERRLTGTKGQGQATYRELIQNIAIHTRPDGGALESIMQKWISSLQINIMNEKGFEFESIEMNKSVQNKIFEVIGDIESLSHGFDFSVAISAYWEGYCKDDNELKQASLRWLRGEFATKTEARRYLKVGEIINDDNWYDYIKLFSSFIKLVGYKGILVFLDEGVNLYKITNKISRENNYEKLLFMFNDTMQGKANNLGIIFGVTPEMIEDERRGLYSYEALRSRLSQSTISSQKGYIDLNGPVLSLQTLTNEELFVLLEKLKDIHMQHYGYDSDIMNDDLVKFMQLTSRLGSSTLITPREVTREFISTLNILHQNSELSFMELIDSGKVNIILKHLILNRRRTTCSPILNYE